MFVQLDYPRMLYKPDGATKVVPSVQERDEAVAAGWFELADLPRPGAPTSEPAPVAVTVPEKPRKARKPKLEGSGE
jgi:hypothetical protein